MNRLQEKYVKEIRPELIKKSASLETELLNSVPIWELTTNQVPDSTFKLLDAVF